MRKSKLESCVEILEALLVKPSTIENLAYRASMDHGTLRQSLTLLSRNQLVKERNSGKRILIEITERGVAVLKALIVQKYLENVKNVIMSAEGIQPVPTVSRNEFENRSDD